MHGDRRVIAHCIHAPDAFIQGFAAEYNIRMLHQEQQQFVLPVFQLDLAPVCGDAARVGIHAQPAERDLVPDARGVCEPRVPREVRFDTRDQHAGRKGLFDIVVRTEPQPADLIDVLLPGGHHQYGDVERVAQPAAHSKAVQSGQHQIEQDQVKLPGQAACKAAFAVRCDFNGKAVDLEIIALDGSDRLVVLNDQNALHDFPPRAR